AVPGRDRRVRSAARVALIQRNDAEGVGPFRRRVDRRHGLAPDFDSGLEAGWRERQDGKAAAELLVIDGGVVVLERGHGDSFHATVRRMVAPAASEKLSPAFVSTVPAGPGERRLALATAVASGVVFVVVVPFATIPLAPLWPFIPMYQSALIVNDGIT